MAVCSFQLWSQSTYNSCSQALELCPGQTFSVSNENANVTLCSPCDDNFSFCFTPNNTIWMKFTTNSIGGQVNVSVSNPVFQIEPGRDTEMQATIIRAGASCDGTTYTAQGNCVSNATSDFTLSANLLPNTQYFVVLNGAKNGVGINLAAEFTVDVAISGNGVNRPQPSIALDYTGIYCLNEIATFIAHLDQCPDSLSYQWYINNQLVAVTQDSIFQTTALKNGDVLSVSNACYQQCRQEVRYDSPAMNVVEFLVDAGLDTTIAYGESIELNGTTNALTYFWSPPYQISSTTILNPTVNPKETTTFVLTGEIGGCQISDAVVVKVGYPLEITNTFSPNEDGINDTWEIPGLVNYPSCLVKIFDRWGQEVFVTSGYNSLKSWDGTRNGKALTEGTYFYSIELRDGSDQVLQGPISIIR